ncbi:lipid A export permease/ATP-binding protein MsbA [Neptuniibacter sp. UBA847]|uniref:lipid A export permease/ATP-binding protein MsbA n=2 Tax=unclassified Neptuniibacter TaxID=2630693 RepID=UPI0025E05CEB|nr:lipid A export permease/ATP-binding protein MsbA [Neptuniibacter sp. UBA847]|tara:strand:- start:11685 stop:13439 length:1755 start_codon:yes stop_codon:yes gene_type:complete
MSERVQEKGAGMKIYFRLLTYVRPYWLPFTLGIIGFILYASTQTGFAALMEYLVDAIGQQKEDAYIFGPLALMGIAIARGIGTFMGNFFTAYVARNIVHQLRIVMFEKLLLIPLDYFHNHASGHILSKISYNVEQVTTAATDSLKISVREGMTVVGLLGYLLYLNWQLTLVFAAVSPLIALVVAMASKRFRRLGHRIQDSMGEVTHVASENVQGVQVVRVFGGGDKERERFADASGQNLRQSLKMALTEALSVPIVQIIVSSALALLIFLALHPLMSTGMSAGQFIAFITAAGLIAKPLRSLTEVNGAIQRGIAAAQSIFELIDEIVESDTGQLIAKQEEGCIELQDLCFSYIQNKPILKNLNLTISPGQTVAFVGKSGSGKSTLANLLPRFYEPTSGSILLNGHELSEYELTSLRSQIALVTQNVVLFDGSIRDNIAYGAMPDVSDEAVIHAAEAAHVMEFVNHLSDGLDTQVGEKGTKLSGGQRQRIAIARAILKNAPVLILDEATSALDTESERHIQAALENVMKDRTTLVIAHRLSTIESADQIVVMDRGEIVEKGTHTELLTQGNIYAGLYQKQFTEND